MSAHENNRMILHTYPAKNSYDTQRGRPHVFGPMKWQEVVPDAAPATATEDQETHCWCGPKVMEWGEKPDGRMGWVIIEEHERQEDPKWH